MAEHYLDSMYRSLTQSNLDAKTGAESNLSFKIISDSSGIPGFDVDRLGQRPHYRLSTPAFLVS